MSILDALILGLIQGITEWLPISSSGHLVIAQHLLHLEVPLSFDIALHLASLCVILVFFRKDLLALFFGILKGDKKQVSLAVQLAVASVPIAAVGLLFKDAIEAAFSSTMAVGFFLILTSFFLFATRLPQIKAGPWVSAILVGIAQALAILPGVSRSGATLSTGIILSRKDAAHFAFLLAIPAILGAALLGLSDLSIVSPLLVLSMAATFISGLASLHILIAIIERKGLFHFGWYCLALGAIAIFL